MLGAFNPRGLLDYKQIQEPRHHKHAANVVADVADDDLATLFRSGFAKREENAETRTGDVAHLSAVHDDGT